MLLYRARTIVTLAGESPARGAGLFRPVRLLDDGAMLVVNGLIERLGSWRSMRVPPGCQVRDLGEATLIPAPLNAHCHLSLSHLAGQTLWGHGFAAWLKSLVPRILDAKNSWQTGAPAAAQSACAAACRQAAAGACHVGDVGGSLPGALSMADSCAKNAGLGISHFCECFGFSPAASPWPPYAREPLPNRAPAGHALYSTAPETLRLVREYCRKHNLVFSMHLAESREEEEQLLLGSGPLHELYRESVLPENWRPPRLRPAALAEKLGLMGPGFLAVHGVWLNGAEMRALAASQSALCLCPRSNRNLAVGDPDIPKLVRNNVLLCLGTDGLTSNTDVNVLNEALALADELPREALWRMLTINAAAALKLPGAGRLVPGGRAEFRIWPGEGGILKDGRTGPAPALERACHLGAKSYLAQKGEAQLAQAAFGRRVDRGRAKLL